MTNKKKEAKVRFSIILLLFSLVFFSAQDLKKRKKT